MAVFLFAKPNFQGANLRVEHNIADMRNSSVGNDSSSMQLTQPADRVVLFGKPIWRGQVLFRRDVQNISHLGDRDQRGKPGFNNDVQSVRITPFTVRLHFHVVKTEDGRLPGGMATEAAATEYVQAITTRASAIWEPALVRLRVTATSFVVSNKFFDLDNEYVGLLLSAVFDVEKGAASVIVNNSIEGNAGLGMPRCISKRVVVEHLGATDTAGAILAHEIGHFLGLLHKNKLTTNLMNHVVGGTDLSDEQIENVHEHLARASDTPRSVREN